MASDTDHIFQSKDYWLIIALISLDIPVTNVECKQDDKKQDYLVWTFPLNESVTDIERRYNLGQPIMVDLQKSKAAAEVFKRNLQYWRIR